MATPFDDAQLEAITGGDTAFEREVLEEYLNSAPEDLRKIRDAVARGDAAATGSAAHALKGASATIGARGFAAIAFEMEQAGKAGDVPRAAGVLGRLEAEFVELTAVLQEKIAKAA